MNKKIYKAFDSIQAEEKIRKSTKEYLFNRTKGYNKKTFFNYKYLLAAVISLFLFLCISVWCYYIPTAKISLEKDASIELNVNRFNRILSYKITDNNTNISSSSDIENKNYNDALEDILKSSDENLLITVASVDQAQSEDIVSHINSYTSKNKNCSCSCLTTEEMKEANELNIPYGKYKAYKILKSLDPTTTINDVKNINAEEIQKVLSESSDNTDKTPDNTENCNGKKIRKQKGKNK